jgi:hypothetical protein
MARPGGLLSQDLGSRLFAVGAYIGEVIPRERGGEWVADDNSPQAEINIAVRLPDGTTCWPVAGLYLHTLEAIFRTSSSGSGGSHLLVFVTSNAASISSAPIPRRRIVPARLINVSLRWPSGMAPPIAVERRKASCTRG